MRVSSVIRRPVVGCDVTHNFHQTFSIGSSFDRPLSACCQSVTLPAADGFLRRAPTDVRDTRQHKMVGIYYYIFILYYFSPS